MIGTVKRVGLSILSARPVYRVLQARALRGNPVTILCYHTLRPDVDRLESWLALRMQDFREQVSFLRRHYDIVSLDEALAAPGTSRPRAVLTFDDGEAAMHELLLPFAEAGNLPVTVYVATSQIESGQPYWFDRVMNALQGDGVTRIDMTDHGMGRWEVGPERGNRRWAEIGAILQALKAVPEDERDALADLIVAQGSPAPEGTTPFWPMTVTQLRELAASDCVTIGAHSHGHELLDQLPFEAALRSAVRSRALLETWTGREVRHFAYPNGNYSPGLMAGLARAGFVSATILEERLVRADAPPLALPRVSVGRYDALDRLRLRMVGI